MIVIPGAVCHACGRTARFRTDLSDPQSRSVTEAISARSCDICGAPVGQPCRNPIRPGEPLPGRIVHIGRLEPR